jgi:hypothetical protein
MSFRVYFLIFWLLPIFVRAQSVKVHSEKDVKWKSYQTFSVATGDLVTVLKTEINEQKVLEEIRKTIIDAMSSRGYTFQENDADLRVDFTAKVVETTNVENIGPLGQEPADQAVEMDQSRTWTQEKKEGSLAMEVEDARSDKSLWRSQLTTEFGSEDLHVMFNSAVGKSFRKFPVKK